MNNGQDAKLLTYTVYGLAIVLAFAGGIGYLYMIYSQPIPPTPTSTPTQTSTFTPTPTDTFTPTSTFTPTPTDTFTPIPPTPTNTTTPMPLPTATLEPPGVVEYVLDLSNSMNRPITPTVTVENNEVETYWTTTQKIIESIENSFRKDDLAVGLRTFGNFDNASCDDLETLSRLDVPPAIDAGDLVWDDIQRLEPTNEKSGDTAVSDSIEKAVDDIMPISVTSNELKTIILFTDGGDQCANADDWASYFQDLIIRLVNKNKVEIRVYIFVLNDEDSPLIKFCSTLFDEDQPEGEQAVSPPCIIQTNTFVENASAPSQPVIEIRNYSLRKYGGSQQRRNQAAGEALRQILIERRHLPIRMVPTATSISTLTTPSRTPQATKTSAATPTLTLNPILPPTNTPTASPTNTPTASPTSTPTPSSTPTSKSIGSPTDKGSTGTVLGLLGIVLGLVIFVILIALISIALILGSYFNTET